METMEKESDTRLYEISYLASADDEQAAAGNTALITDVIEKKHGIIANQIQPLRKVLEYPINKEREAWLGYIRFVAKPENISEIKTNIKKNEKILRFALFRAGKAESIEKPKRKKVSVQTPEEKTSIAEIDKKLEEMLGE